MTAMTVAELEDFMLREFPQMTRLNMRVTRLEEGGLWLHMPIGFAQLRPGGTVSGPTIMTLADAAIYLLVLSQLGPVALAVTTTMTINFLRRPAVKDLIARTHLLKLGRRLAVGEVEVYSDGEDDPVAHVVATYSIP